jgi:NitT/TauT family transport system substrate-binding protein
MPRRRRVMAPRLLDRARHRDHDTGGRRMRLHRRTLLAAALGSLAAPGLALGQSTERLRVILNFRQDGGTAGYLLALSRGYFREVGLDVAIDGSGGSGDAVTRTASGAYQIGTADLSTLVEFYTRNPQTCPVYVAALHDVSPQAIISLSHSNIARPQDLVGKRIGQGAADATSRMFPAFCRINGIDMASMTRQQVTPALRDQMLLTRQVDAVTGFDQTVFFNLKANGVNPDTIRMMRFADFGMDLPGNGVIVGRSFLAEKPDVVRRFLQASTRCWHEVMANPRQAAAELKRQFPLLEEPIEMERIEFIRDRLMVTPRTRAEGLGFLSTERVAQSITMVKEGFELTTGVPTVEQVFDSRVLPAAAERRLRGA